jgi:hypothetical protein
MKITGMKTCEQLAALMRECYPAIPGIAVPEISPRIRAKIEGLVRRINEADPNDAPSWNAGRGSTLA